MRYIEIYKDRLSKDNVVIHYFSLPYKKTTLYFNERGSFNPGNPIINEAKSNPDKLVIDLDGFVNGEGDEAFAKAKITIIEVVNISSQDGEITLGTDEIDLTAGETTFEVLY